MKTLLGLCLLVASFNISAATCNIIYKTEWRGFFYFHSGAEASLVQAGKAVTRDESNADLFVTVYSTSLYNNNLAMDVQRRDGVTVFHKEAKGKDDEKNENRLIKDLGSAKFNCEK